MYIGNRTHPDVVAHAIIDMDMRIINLLVLSLLISCSLQDNSRFKIASEFDEQEFIWFSWQESSWLNGQPLYIPILEAIKQIHPYSKIKIVYSPHLNYNKEQLQSRIYDVLLNSSVDTSRVELFYNESPIGAIQDPGPVFVRNGKGEMAVVDFQYQQGHPLTANLDKNVGQQMNLPIIPSTLFSEGGAWQTNGEGTMLLVESIELDRNKTLTKEQIENEYKRVLGVEKIIWLKSGCKEEEWQKLENGIYGIGTGGHIDEFCRFVNPSTVLLAKVNEADTIANEIAKESYRRMEENYEILKQSTTRNGRPIEIIRLPVGPLITDKVHFNSLSMDEQSWFENVMTDTIEYYLASGFMNFVIANKIVVRQSFGKKVYQMN